VAQAWQSGAHSHDYDCIPLPTCKDTFFGYPKASALLGKGEVNGKPALRDYWSRALAQQADLSFVVVNVFGGHGMMVICYGNHRDVLAAETLRFGPDGLVVEASACHAS